MRIFRFTQVIIPRHLSTPYWLGHLKVIFIDVAFRVKFLWGGRIRIPTAAEGGWLYLMPCQHHDLCGTRVYMATFKFKQNLHLTSV